MSELPPLYTYTNGYQARWIDGKNKLEHIRIVEKVMGRPVPVGFQVHHLDGNKTNNANSNLVVCPSQSYHHLLHKRQEAFDNTGHYDHLKCVYCKGWGGPDSVYSNKYMSWHKTCKNKYQNERRRRVRG